MDYYSKYLKYKNKYLNLKNNTTQSAGANNVPGNFVIITNSKGNYAVINYDNYDRYIERWYDLKNMGWIDENEPMPRPLGGTNDESNSRQNNSNNSNNTTYQVGDEVTFTPTSRMEENVYDAPRGDSNIINRLDRGTSHRARVIRAIPSSHHNNVLVTREYYTLQLLDPPYGYIPEASVGSISRRQNNVDNEGNPFNAVGSNNLNNESTPINTTYQIGDEVIFTPTRIPEENVYNAPRGNSNIIDRLNRGTSYRARVLRATPLSQFVLSEYYTLQLLDPPQGYIPEASVNSISRGPGGQNNSNSRVSIKYRIV